MPLLLRSMIPKPTPFTLKQSFFRLVLLLLFALPGENALRAQVLEKLPLPDLSTPALNLMRLDRLMAPGLTVWERKAALKGAGVTIWAMCKPRSR